MARYPSLFRRYMGSMIDAVVLLSGLYVYVQLTASLPKNIVVPFALLLLICYEPLLTVWACTPGQAVMRYRVRNMDDGGRIELWAAFTRMFVKYLLGIISFMTIPATKNRRALHDMAAASIVVEASPRT